MYSLSCTEQKKNNLSEMKFLLSAVKTETWLKIQQNPSYVLSYMYSSLDCSEGV